MLWLMEKTLKNDKIRKIATGQADYYTTSCLLDYNISKNITSWQQ